jgi:putative colanic acid biosynthesis acetyltransferase WcaF
MKISRVDISRFNSAVGFNLGRSRLVFAVWYLTKIVIFLSPFPWPSTLKVALLRVFGAQVGEGCYIKPRVNIHFPWKIRIGRNVCIGEEVFICNFADVTIGNNCCISQRAFICSGNHNYKTPDMAYLNKPIDIQDGCWVGAMAFVGPGAVMETDSVLCAGSFVFTRTNAAFIYSGNPATPKKGRW